jgi:excisionase family DNA binding protein
MKTTPLLKDQPSTDLLTPQQVCERLKISTRTLGRYIHEHRIPFIRLKGLYRFNASSIINYLFEQETMVSTPMDTTISLSQSTHQVMTTVNWWLSVHKHVGDFCMSMVQAGILSKKDSDALQKQLKAVDAELRRDLWTAS